MADKSIVVNYKSEMRHKESTKTHLSDSHSHHRSRTRKSNHRTSTTVTEKDTTANCVLVDSNSNSKLKSLKKTISRTFAAKNHSATTGHFGDNENVTNHGSLKQYCVKGNDVLLRDVHFIRNEKSRMLMITVDNKTHQTDTYNILYTKDVCPYTFKDSNAFILKVSDIDKKLKSMTFQAGKEDEKKCWISRYSLSITVCGELLNLAISEVERRRFQLGVKKRSEEKSKLKIEGDVLVDLVGILGKKHELELASETKWTVGNLERLIQLVLNEISQPLITFSSQKLIRKLELKEFSAELESKTILNNLPSANRLMLVALLNHMERLSKYYLIVMSSPKKILPQIRRNICKRLSPIVFRLQHDLENHLISGRCSDVMYHLMIGVNNTTDSY